MLALFCFYYWRETGFFPLFLSADSITASCSVKTSSVQVGLCNHGSFFFIHSASIWRTITDKAWVVPNPLNKLFSLQKGQLVACLLH